MSSTKLSLGMLILAANMAFATPIYAAPAEENVQAETIETNDVTVTDSTDSEEQLSGEEETEAPAIIYAADEEAADAQSDDAEAFSEETAEEDTEEVNEDESEAGVSGNAVIEFAKRFVGGRYRYGGTSLTNGTDCSGFTMSVYRNFGISLPHSSRSQRSVGTAVSSLAEAKAGDLICYSGHVALYLGDGQIVHAQNAKKGITISNACYSQILAIRRVL